MIRPRPVLRLALPALVAIPLLVACSSSNKNNNTTNKANSAPATTVAATIATTPSVAAATPAAARSATPSTTAAGAAGTPTRAAGATGASTPSISSAIGTAAAVAQGTPTDAALEAQLKSAILQESDLPTGFSQQATDDTVDTSSGMTAGYNATYTMIGQGSSGLDIEAIVVALAGFKDTSTAQSNFKDIQTQIQQGAGEDVQLTPINNATSVGDQSVAFKVAGNSSGVDIAGYAIIWRHGKLAAAIVQVGAPGPQNINQAVTLAQAQDKKLNNVH